jgi:hypothetical protein
MVNQTKVKARPFTHLALLTFLNEGHCLLTSQLHIGSMIRRWPHFLACGEDRLGPIHCPEIADILPKLVLPCYSREHPS